MRVRYSTSAVCPFVSSGNVTVVLDVAELPDTERTTSAAAVAVLRRYRSPLPLPSRLISTIDGLITFTAAGGSDRVGGGPVVACAKESPGRGVRIKREIAR